ncbi:hypothetical protein [Acinetobacter brisouii]|uniref:hypothetical protein n=1 Tax=Acinetobacter brisouii TaxID=396323 RepID=UPI0012506E4B|nr:hypothetical protein [Acinetobacter brisouii]
MSNIQVFNEEQEFKDILAVNFPVQIAEQILEHMEKLFGAEFHAMHQHMGNQELLNLTCAVLSGLKTQDLRRGIDRLNTEKRCPKLSEFRSWCGSEWFGANEAWAMALTFTNDRKAQITCAAKQALDQVQHIIQTEGLKSAGFAFREIYARTVSDLKELGAVQEFWENKALDKSKNLLSCTSPENRNRAIEGLSDHQKRVVSRQSELMSQGLSAKEARSQAQKELGLKTIPVNKLHNNTVHKPNHKPVTEFQTLVARGVSVQDAFKQVKNGVKA